jgi:rubredoxin
MERQRLCPICAAGDVVPTAGRLDQSGETYLPTVVWACNTCGYARYEPAVHAGWQPRHAPAEDEEQVDRRRAA